MHCRESFVIKILLLQSISTNKFADVSQCLMVDSCRALFGDQFINLAHFAPSRSATIASIEVRSSD